MTEKNLNVMNCYNIFTKKFISHGQKKWDVFIHKFKKHGFPIKEYTEAKLEFAFPSVDMPTFFFLDIGLL